MTIGPIGNILLVGFIVKSLVEKYNDSDTSPISKYIKDSTDLVKDSNKLKNINQNINIYKPYLIYLFILAAIILNFVSDKNTDVLLDGILKNSAESDKINFKNIYIIILLLFLTAIPVFLEHSLGIFLIIIPILIFMLCYWNSNINTNDSENPNENNKTQYIIYNVIGLLIVANLCFNVSYIYSIKSGIDKTNTLWYRISIFGMFVLFCFPLFCFINIFLPRDIKRFNSNDKNNNDYFNTYTNIIKILIIIIIGLLCVILLSLYKFFKKNNNNNSSDMKKSNSPRPNEVPRT